MFLKCAFWLSTITQINMCLAMLGSLSIHNNGSHMIEAGQTNINKTVQYASQLHVFAVYSWPYREVNDGTYCITISHYPSYPSGQAGVILSLSTFFFFFFLRD